MALKLLTEALGMLVKKPLVWMPGLFAAFTILFTYYLFTLFGSVPALAAGIILLLVFPAFLAGTYGIVIGDKSSSADFRKYAVYGYFRCLIPNLVVLMIGFVLSNTLTYILLMLGISVDAAFYYSIFLIIPLVFFFYFADISAMVNNFATFRAIKDSALRVTTGSISVTAFYLFNVAIFFATAFIFSTIWSLLAVDVLTPITQMSEAEILAMFQEELLALFTSPEIISSGCMALAICAIVFVPIFVTYKACFYKRNLLNLPAQPSQQNQQGQQGTVDEKGRWYKYS
ncbi:hypothetical protein [uncultured Methanocorpusculum sp.]|nr:hypothetical protein [uncultured Methanocorpusculum sp.]